MTNNTITYPDNPESNCWVTLEIDQKSVKPTIKINEHTLPLTIDNTINNAVHALVSLKQKLLTEGYTMAPLPIKEGVTIKR